MVNTLSVTTDEQNCNEGVNHNQGRQSRYNNTQKVRSKSASSKIWHDNHISGVNVQHNQGRQLRSQSIGYSDHHFTENKDTYRGESINSNHTQGRLPRCSEVENNRSCPPVPRISARETSNPHDNQISHKQEYHNQGRQSIDIRQPYSRVPGRDTYSPLENKERSSAVPSQHNQGRQSEISHKQEYHNQGRQSMDIRQPYSRVAGRDTYSPLDNKEEHKDRSSAVPSQHNQGRQFEGRNAHRQDDKWKKQKADTIQLITDTRDRLEQSRDRSRLLEDIRQGKYITNKTVTTPEVNNSSKSSPSVHQLDSKTDHANVYSDSTIKVRLGKYVTSALVDTGAKISCIANSEIRKSGLKDKYTLEPADISSVIGVGGSSNQVLGQATLPIDIGGLTLQQKFYVLERLTQPIILGLDFINSQKAQFDFNHHTLLIQDGMTEVPMGLMADREHSKLIRLVGHVSIKPRSETIVLVRARPSKEKRQIGVIESSATLPGQLGVKGARCLVELTNNYSSYKVLNPTNSHIDLKDRQVLGRFIPVTAEDIKGYLESEEDVEYVSSIDTKNAHTDEHYIHLAKDVGIDVSKSDLSEEEKKQLLILIGKNRDVFAKDLSELGMCTEGNYTHKIDTGNSPPVKQRFYRASPKMKEELSPKIDEMLNNNIIEPASTEWLSPVILVKKSDGDMRFCIDYRALNAVSQPMHFPLPRLEEIIDTLAESKAKLYSKLDLLSGFWQIKLDPATKHKTGFITHRGVHQFVRLPFGLSGAPGSFQMMMTEVLRDMAWKFALVYVDDILIFSTDFTEHLSHLAAVFQRLREANLRLKPSKCQFAAQQVQYLGHVLSKKGIAVDTAKTEAVQSFPTPKNVHDVRAFLGLCNYYRRFVHKFAEKAVPLNRLLKKEAKFDWSTECETAFTELKAALVSPPILSFPDFSKEFIVYTDASDFSLGYVLGQLDSDGREVVIAYGGRSLQPNETNWGITDKECLALVEAVKNYHVYLASSRFKVYTDHIALTYFNSMKLKTGRLLRWAMFLQQYRIEVIHKPGRVHQNADALSRRVYDQRSDTQHPDRKEVHENKTTEITPQRHPTIVEQMAQAEVAYLASSPMDAIQEVLTVSHDDIKAAQRGDPKLAPYIEFLENDTLPDDKKLASRIRDEQLSYQLTDGILYHLYSPRGKGPKGDREVKQLCVPNILRDDILRSYHDALGHQGQDRTQRAISLKYFWPRMQSDIEYYVKSCVDCQTSKQYFHRKHAPLRPLPVGDVFSRIHVDVLGSLTKSHDGYTHILLVVCAFSKWCEAFPLRSTKADVIAKVLYSEIFCRFGPPRELLSDRGANFLSKIVAELCKMHQVTKTQTSSYRPQTNSACERMNRTIEQTLRAYCDPDLKNWADVLPSVLHAYRMTPATESTGFSPYYMMFLREPTLPIDVALLPVPNIGREANEHLKQLRQQAERVREIAKDNITAAQTKYAHQHNKRAAPPQFKVQQRVWMHCKKTTPGLSPKLCKKWLGPYYVCIDYENLTYKLRRESDHKLVKSVVHADRLRPFVDPAERPTNPPETHPDEDNDLNPEELTDEDIPSQAINEDAADNQRDDNLQDLVNTDRADAVDDRGRNKAPEQGPSEDSEEPEQTQSQANTQVRRKRTPYTTDEIVKILRSTKDKGIFWYNVRLKHAKPGWISEDLLPGDLIRNFHATKTQSGHARKRRLQGRGLSDEEREKDQSAVIQLVRTRCT